MPYKKSFPTLAIKTLVQTPHITIEYDPINEWVYANWTGPQDAETGKDGCEKILNAIKETRSQKLLNDNSDITAFWYDEEEWISKNWFPRLYAAGCFFLAWIYSPQATSRFLTEAVLALEKTHVKTLLFDNTEAAACWLKSAL